MQRLEVQVVQWNFIEDASLTLPGAEALAAVEEGLYRALLIYAEIDFFLGFLNNLDYLNQDHNFLYLNFLNFDHSLVLDQITHHPTAFGSSQIWSQKTPKYPQA